VSLWVAEVDFDVSLGSVPAPVLLGSGFSEPFVWKRRERRVRMHTLSAGSHVLPARLHVCLHVCGICIRVHNVYAHVYVCIYILHIYMCNTYTYMYIYLHTHTCIYTYIYICIRIHTHTYIHAWSERETGRLTQAATQRAPATPKTRGSRQGSLN